MHTTPAAIGPRAVRSAFVLCAAALAVSSCSSDSTGIGAATSSQLAFSATTSGAASGALATLVPVTTGGHTLDLTAIKLTVSRAELKRAKTDACAGDDDENDEHPKTTASTESCGELKIGPTTIDMPVNGTLVSVPGNAIPAGTYRELELRVSTVELKGTYDGKAFDVTIPVSARSEIDFATPLVVTEGTPAAITVNVPVAGWLVSSSGALIDPNTILASPTLTAQVKAKIAASFHAFEDRDHDGKDDHGHG